MIDWDALALAGTLAGINMALVGYVTAPLKQNPGAILIVLNWARNRMGLESADSVNWWWISYLALASGVVMATLAEINIAPSLGWVGVVLSGVVIGGGASVIYDVIDGE